MFRQVVWRGRAAVLYLFQHPWAFQPQNRNIVIKSPIAGLLRGKYGS
jgi:hypothetical protein